MCIYLCIACCECHRRAQLNKLSEAGELPGHSTASNIVANYSFSSLVERNIRIHLGQGAQIQYLSSHYGSIATEIQNFIETSFAEQRKKVLRALYGFIIGTIIAAILMVIIMAVNIIAGFVIFLLFLIGIFGYVFYARNANNEYRNVLLPGLQSFIRHTLLLKYSNGNDLKGHILYPAKWNTTFNSGEFITIRFTLGKIQQPYGAPIYWSSNDVETNDSSLPTGWRAGYTQQGKIFYINDVTKKTQWEHPANQRNQTSEKKLKIGWKKLKTNESRVYYVNDNLKTTQWEHPGYEPELPPGWKQGLTKDKKVYYINDETKTTQWERPEYEKETQIEVQIESNQIGLPSGWRREETKEGRVFYVNDELKTTQWEHPGNN